MSAPAQQAMSPADVKEMKDFLGVAAVSGATIEAFEKHGVAKQQLAQMEDTHMQQMNIMVGDQLRIKKAIRALKVAESREQALKAAESANKAVATYSNTCCCCCVPCTCCRTTWVLSEAGILEKKRQCCGSTEQNNIDFSQVVDINRESAGCGGCVGTITIKSSTGETAVLATNKTEPIFDEIKKYWHAAKAAGTAWDPILGVSRASCCVVVLVTCSWPKQRHSGTALHVPCWPLEGWGPAVRCCVVLLFLST